MPEHPPGWHPEVLPVAWPRAADDLARRGALTGFYLAGSPCSTGTGARSIWISFGSSSSTARSSAPASRASPAWSASRSSEAPRTWSCTA
jgi:hypothetical protein